MRCDAARPLSGFLFKPILLCDVASHTCDKLRFLNTIQSGFGGIFFAASAGKVATRKSL